MLGARECKSRYWAYRNQGMSHDEAFDAVHQDIVDYYRPSGQVIYGYDDTQGWLDDHQLKQTRRIERSAARRYNRRYNRRQKGRV